MFARAEALGGLDTPEAIANVDRPTYVRKPVLRGHGRRAKAGGADRGRPRVGRVRRLGDHGPHLARRRDQEAEPRRAVADRERRRAARLQSYGSRRGNHEVMIRGTFANIRLRNKLVEQARAASPATSPTGRRRRSTRRRCATRTRRAAGRPRRQGVRVGLVARLGREGHELLGVRAVIAESFERIHRSNLIGMGVAAAPVPRRGVGRVAGADGRGGRSRSATSSDGGGEDAQGDRARGTAATRSSSRRGPARHPNEVRYFQHGGILHRVLRDFTDHYAPAICNIPAASGARRDSA